MFEWLIPSMKAIYNSRIIDKENIQISANNRGFCYGDGLFETIVTGPDRINLINIHKDRIRRHCALLSMNPPEALIDRLEDFIEELSQANNIASHCRSKVQIWRTEGGLYTPNQHSSEFLITQKESNKAIIRTSEIIGISNKVHNHSSDYACVKSLNALDYVMAGNELQERDLDEIIILDNRGYLSETHIGNLFWVKDNTLFTPSLKTGCIEGVMRTFILGFCKDNNLPLNIVMEKASTLKDAECIFSTNASGITYFSKLEGSAIKLEDASLRLQKLIIRLQQP